MVRFPDMHPLEAVKISVLLPVYNDPASFLERSVDSILHQTFQDFELIIIDDGSNQPETLQKLEQLRCRDPRIRVHHHNHTGIIGALNLGLTLAKGDLICRQDADDWSEPERFARQVEFLNRRPELAVVGSNIVLHQEDGTVLWRSTLPLEPSLVLATFPETNPFTHGATCFRRSCALAVGGYRSFALDAEDYDLFWRLCERFGGANLSEGLYHFRKNAGSVMAQRTAEALRNVFIIRELAKMRAEGREEELEAARRNVATNYTSEALRDMAQRSQAAQKMMAGRYAEAFRVQLDLLVSRPFNLKGYLYLVRLILFYMFPPLRKHLVG